MATSDNLPRPNCDSDGKAENMRQRTVVWLIYHQSECQEEVIFVNFPCASEVVSRQGVSVDPPERVALARRVVFIRDFKIVDYGWLRRLGMCHATKISMRCHRRASETVCFPAISRCGEDGKNHSR